MKQFIVGLVVGASLSGSIALAFENPLQNLPIQEQINRLIVATDGQFRIVSAAFETAQLFFTDIDERPTVIEKKLKIKRDE